MSDSTYYLTAPGAVSATRLHGVDVRCSSRRGGKDLAGVGQQVGAHIGGREVVGGVVGLLPHEIDGGLGVGNRLAAQHHPALGAVLDADAAVSASGHGAVVSSEGIPPATVVLAGSFPPVPSSHQTRGAAVTDLVFVEITPTFARLLEPQGRRVWQPG
jgi:hypothetical protein